MATKSVFEEGSRVSIYKFLPEQIKVDGDLNGRRELPSVDWLVKDIVEHGQLEPVIVRKDGDRPALVAGFSRWRAIRQINQEKLLPEGQQLEILATYFRGNERDGFLANIRENRFRNSTTALDDAHNIARMLAWNMDEQFIASVYFPDLNGDAAKTKKAVAWVKRTAKLANLTDEAREAVRDGRVKPSAAAHIAEMAAEAQRDLLKESTGKVSAKDVDRASGKKITLTVAQVRGSIEHVLEKERIEGHPVPPFVLDWLKGLAEKM